MNGNLKHRTDKEILALVSKTFEGDQNAYTLLYKQLTPFVKPIIYNRIYKITSCDFNILTHDIVSHILIKLPLFQKQKGYFFSWAGQIASNYIIDFHRKNSRVISLQDQYPDITLVENLSPESILLTKEKRNLVKTAIQKLPEEKQSIINDYSLGLPIKEIATKNNKSEGAISIDIFRIKSQIIKTISQGEK